MQTTNLNVFTTSLEIASRTGPGSRTRTLDPGFLCYLYPVYNPR